MRLFLLFLTVPVLEIVVFVKITQLTGLHYTVFLIIATALIGTLAVRKQGLEVLKNLKNGLNNPLTLLSNGLIILLAGILLLTPGFITDTVGFSLLIPRFRRYLILIASNKIMSDQS
jgi:UPF0716 protein FxsA